MGYEGGYVRPRGGLKEWEGDAIASNLPQFSISSCEGREYQENLYKPSSKHVSGIYLEFTHNRPSQEIRIKP